MASRGGPDSRDWRFSRFGLIVTGETEEACMADLFRLIAASGRCSFTVIRRVGQRSPITSARRKQQMVGTGKTIPDKDADEIGFPARKFLSADDTFVLLVDDLEARRRDEVEGVFGRYRLAFDTILGSRSPRASVHFLVNMLEAYYFADAEAVNGVLGTDLTDFPGDVETIANPKSRLKGLVASFNERRDGVRIVRQLDIAHVLANEDACASLRTMFAWTGEAIGESGRFSSGRLFDTTRGQIQALRTYLGRT